MDDKTIKYDNETEFIVAANDVRSLFGIDKTNGLAGNVSFDLLVNETANRVDVQGSQLPTVEGGTAQAPKLLTPLQTENFRWAKATPGIYKIGEIVHTASDEYEWIVEWSGTTWSLINMGKKTGSNGTSGVRKAMNESGDLATDFSTWETDKTLNAVTGATQWGRDTDSVSGFKEVVGGASKIYIKAKSTSAQYPTTIFGFDENKNPVGVLLSGGAVNGNYVYPDSNISFVRFAVNNYQNIPEIKLITLADDINGIIDKRESQVNYAVPEENAVYENGTEWSEKYGSQKTPVSEGDVVVTNAKGVHVGSSKVAALSLYDSEGAWIGFVEQFNTVAYREYAYRRQYTVPAGVGFVKASFFGITNVSDRYLYIERKGALTIGDIKRRVNDIYENSVIFKTFDDASLAAADLTKTGTTYTKAGAGNVTITLPHLEQRVTSELRMLIHVIKLRITDVTGDLNIAGKTGIRNGDTVQFSFTRGEYSLVYQNFHIKDFSFDKGCSFELLENKTFVIDRNTALKLVNNSDITDPVVTNWRVFYQFLQFGAEIDPGLFQEFSKGFEISTYSMQSRYARFKQVSPAFKNGVYVAFGDSISVDGDAHKTNYPHVVATELGMKLNNLAVSGSAPAQGTGWNWNLSDEQLAKVSPQTMLVTIGGGQNGWKTSSDIETRDRTTSIGAINYAIDHIYNVAPKAVIVLIGDPNGIGGNQADYKRISENRILPFVDIKNQIDWAGDVERKVLRFDDVHPTEYGVWRIAAVVLDTVRKFIV